MLQQRFFMSYFSMLSLQSERVPHCREIIAGQISTERKKFLSLRHVQNQRETRASIFGEEWLVKRGK